MNAFCLLLHLILKWGKCVIIILEHLLLISDKCKIHHGTDIPLYSCLIYNNVKKSIVNCMFLFHSTIRDLYSQILKLFFFFMYKTEKSAHDFRIICLTYNIKNLL